MVPWDVEFDPDCESWANSLTDEDQEALLAAIRVLGRVGPSLGRPLVDRVKGSQYKNMKELRPPSSGTSEVRLLFAFDPLRQAILLVGGDKSGAWTGWYTANIPVADARYRRHLEQLEASVEKKTNRRRPQRRKP